MIEKLNSQYDIVLASQSPRRQQLLNDLGLIFEVLTYDVEENIPNNMSNVEVVKYLAELKSSPFKNLKNNHLIISADTIVCKGEQIIGKPHNAENARKMLFDLANSTHEVLTGVCIKTKDVLETFYSRTTVEFAQLDESEVDYYLSKYKPFDKAGAYGIQEWIGMIAIKSINGSYYNVMGLPVNLLYSKLKQLLINN